MPEPTVPKHSSQGSVHIDETTVNSSNPSNIDEASERPRDLWLSILQQQVECHANKLDSFEEAVNAILRAQATDAERMRTIERRTHEQMKTIERRTKAIQREMQSLQCEYETHAEQFRLRISETGKQVFDLQNRLDELQNSLQFQRIASAARPDWNRH